MEHTYTPVIGLEIHVELKTASKMFCGCPADHFGKEPNSQTCPVCLGLPGALPVPNRQAVEWTVLLGLALGCQIPLDSKFDRKHYFYPDLPKGYQISQYEEPFCRNGSLSIRYQPEGHHGRETVAKQVRIRRVHLEEDTGKLVHTKINDEPFTLVDFNRSGVPLVEIVTEPDIRSAEEAKAFLKKLHQVIRYLGISDADMEKGSMRLEPNISVSMRPIPDVYQENDLPPYKVEVKNINSFNFVARAIGFELSRQQEILVSGQIPPQENRGWSEDAGQTIPQRSKEEAKDYRYFPEPDIPPVRWTTEDIERIRQLLPELPDQKAARFTVEHRLTDAQVLALVGNPTASALFEQGMSYGTKYCVTSSELANWLINKPGDYRTVKPEELVRTISEAKQTDTMTDQELLEQVKSVLSEQPQAVADYRKGKVQVIGFLTGMVLRKTGKKLDPNKVRTVLLEALQT